MPPIGLGLTSCAGIRRILSPASRMTFVVPLNEAGPEMPGLARAGQRVGASRPAASRR